jgi:hypothetical protein
MWHTPSGDRTLTGAEKQLFIDGAGSLLDYLLNDLEAEEHSEEGVKTEVGVKVFDQMDTKDKIYALFLVTKALIEETLSPPHTAWNEATIYAVFQFIGGEIEVDLDLDDPPNPGYWQSLVFAAAKQCKLEAEITKKCKSAVKWLDLLEEVADQILWDRDWEIPDLKIQPSGVKFLDQPPEDYERQLEILGIGQDYYLATCPNPKGNDLKLAIQYLMALDPERKIP